MRLAQSLSRFVTFLSVGYLLFLGSLAFVNVWPVDGWWLGNVIEIAPLWVLFIPVVVFIVFGNLRSWVINILSGLLIFFAIMGFCWSPPFEDSPKSNNPSVIRIVSINMGAHQRPEWVLAWMMDVSADVMAFQELDSQQEDYLRAHLPVGWDLKTEGHLGLASRFKILKMTSQDRRLVGGWGGIISKFVLDAGLSFPQPIVIGVLHLATPREGINALIQNRWNGIEEMKRVTQAQEEESAIAENFIAKTSPLLIVGDFNMSSSNPIFHRYWGRFQDAFAKGGRGFGYTKHTRWHGVRIDHILADEAWDIISASVGPNFGGDHHPILAEVVLK